MAFQSDQDWQLTKKTVLERTANMFNNPLMSDIKFTCGESKRKYFYAHKYVLAISSPVFYTMFYGNLAEKNSVIHLPDINDESFEEFLRFLYTDECTLAPEMAVAVKYLAKKYMIPCLEEKCSKVVKGSVTPDNAVVLLDKAIQFVDKKLEKKCLEIVVMKTSEAVKSAGANNISQTTLINILKQDNLNINEQELFQAVLKWSDRQLLNNGLKTTSENRKKVLGEAVYQMRYLSMSEKEFSHNIYSSGLLTAEEMVTIYEMFNGISRPASASQCNLSKRQHYKRCSIGRPHNGYLCAPDTEPENLSVSFSESVFIHGVRLFGDRIGSEFEVQLNIDGESVVDTYDSMITNKGNGYQGYDVMLPKPVPVDQNKVIDVSVTIKGPQSLRHRICGKQSTKVDGLTVIYNDGFDISKNNENVSTQKKNMRSPVHEIVFTTATS